MQEAKPVDRIKYFWFEADTTKDTNTVCIVFGHWTKPIHILMKDNIKMLLNNINS